LTFYSLDYRSAELYTTTSSQAGPEKTFIVRCGITAPRYMRGDYYDHFLTTFEVSQASLTQEDGHNASFLPVNTDWITPIFRKDSACFWK